MTNALLAGMFDKPGFRAWKLQTPGDYFFFFLILFGGVLIFYLIGRYLKKHRTREDAVRRVAGKLKGLGSGAESYIAPTLSNGRDSIKCELLSVTKDRVYVVKVFHLAQEAGGTATSDYWRFRLSPKEAFDEVNPLPSLKEQQFFIKNILSENGLVSVPVERLVVFADRFGATRIGLQGVQCACGIEKLRSMNKKSKPLPAIDIQKTKEALEARFV